ncbi:YbgC/FadM family acyl-CoA thioesterase [Novosphingobium flavum]|uniref:YbgC/FadM family acyl-CoA thioesterase n=1 Tax=Novosphingobium flavum TaxID=1778672 RepID=A0A7X1KMX1_9SPHN|nr:YbgC/FadM family acyl-CoA thioesterase [Novosphingobium flavum]MBC2667094.1 YbgC/FadM family acyl-CoA thioesterase [Novosphingobium flavum]
MPNQPAPPSGCLDGPVHRLAVRAYYEDTDLSGAVYHANYLRWFERGRSDLVRLLGIDQRAAQESGAGTYAVSEVTIRYLAPARLDDVVTIETHAEDVGAASCRLVQRALRDGQLLSEARVRVGFIGPDGRPKRQPAAWRAAFSSILDTETT